MNSNMEQRLASGILVFLVGISLAIGATAQTRDEKVRNDKAKVETEGFWIYNDLQRAFAEAKKTGKPMLVLFRCIPWRRLSRRRSCRFPSARYRGGNTKADSCGRR